MRRTPAREELPILAELGAEYEAMLDAEFRPVARRPAAGDGLRLGRALRRGAIAVGLASLVGTAALAGQAVLGGAPDGPATLGTVAVAGEPWELSGGEADGRICATLAGASAVERGCFGAPARREARAASARSPSRRIVYGLAGAEVARVRVTAAGRRIDAPTRAAADGGAATGAGLPAGVRFFLVDAGPAGSAAAPARVTPLDHRGRPLGRAWLDCSLGAASAACAGRVVP